MIPILHQPAHSRNRIEYLRYSDRKRDCATRPPAKVLLAGLLRQLFQLLLVQIEAFSAVGFNELHIVGSRPIDVDREVIAGHKRGRGNESYDADEPFQ